MDKSRTNAQSRKSKVTSQLKETNNNTTGVDNTYKKNKRVPDADEIIVQTTEDDNVNAKETADTLNCPKCKHTVNKVSIRGPKVLGIMCRNCYHIFTVSTHENRVVCNSQFGLLKTHVAKKESLIQNQLKRPKIVHVDVSIDVELQVPAFTLDSQTENNARLRRNNGLPVNSLLPKESCVISKAEVTTSLNNQLPLPPLISRSKIEIPLNNNELKQISPLRADMSPPINPIITPSPYLTLFQGNVVRPTINNVKASQSKMNYLILRFTPSHSQPPVKEPETTINIDDSDDECTYITETNFDSATDLEKVSDIEKRIVIVDDGLEEREVKEEIVWLEEAEEVEIGPDAPYPVAVASSLNRKFSSDLQDMCDNDRNIDLTNDYLPDIMGNNDKRVTSNNDRRDVSNHDKQDDSNHDKRDQNDNGFLKIEAVTTLSKEQFSTLTNDAILTGYEKDLHQLEKKQNNFGSEFLKFLENGSTEENVNQWMNGGNRKSKATQRHVPDRLGLPYPNLVRGFTLTSNEADLEMRFKCAINPLKVIDLTVRHDVSISTVKQCLTCYNQARFKIDDQYLATVVSDWEILKCSYCARTSYEVKISTANLKCFKTHSSVERVDNAGDRIHFEGSSANDNSSNDALDPDDAGLPYVESESWRALYVRNKARARYRQRCEMVYTIYTCSDCLPNYVSVSKYASLQSREIYFKCLVCEKFSPATNVVMLY